MSVDESIHLEPYDERWAERFREERDALARELGGDAAGIEHIGSTAVPGLAAKPIVDLMIGVHDFTSADRIVAKLCLLGYEYLGEAGVPGRLYLRKRSARDFNAHIVLHGGDHWSNNLAIRDYLRADAREREHYEARKKDIVQSGAVTLLDYSERKSDFIAGLLERAKAWSAARGNGADTTSP
jgi:GrpB-like predicted nucleotidyltransferase (UPF0157 family)